jgi:glyoxalase family protein
MIMENKILGLHHITAIASGAQRNHDFYARVLGLRLVKKTVNFDDPKTYHFYYGDEKGSPGTLITFFPWEGAAAGRPGTGLASHIGYSVPEGSFDFWMDRFKRFDIQHEGPREQFGEKYLEFADPDGLKLSLIVSKTRDDRIAWSTPEVKHESATRGFHSVVLTIKSIKATADLLTHILGYHELGKEGNCHRFVTDAVGQAAIVDLIESPELRMGQVSAGIIHHIAFRVKDEKTLMECREIIAARGLEITPKIDRDYFFSVYFLEPGGVLFELATENPGFCIDEPVAELGNSLKLPKKLEPLRPALIKVLPTLV